MKIKVKIDETDLKSIVESVLTDRYKFDCTDDDFEEKVEIAMSNKEFTTDICKNIAAEISDNLIDEVYQYAGNFTVKSPKYYGLKK